MTAQIINLADILSREVGIVANEGVAQLFDGAKFAAEPAQIAEARRVFLFARDHCPFVFGKNLIERFLSTPCADADARYCRDALALAFALDLQTRHLARDEALDFYDDIADRLFPLRDPPHPAT